LTRMTLNSDQRKAARLRMPVRNRSPSSSLSLTWAADQVVEPLRATSTLPSFSITTQF